MSKLIALHQETINGQLIDTVSARELHQFLEVGKDFSTWIRGRIDSYNFEGGTDFIAVPKSGELMDIALTTNTRRERVEYYLTLDMAKELSMVERNEKGRQARKYFIECEKG